MECELVWSAHHEQVDVAAARVGAGGHRAVNDCGLHPFDCRQRFAKGCHEPLALDEQRAEIHIEGVRGLNGNEDLMSAPMPLDQGDLFEQSQLALCGFQRDAGASRDLADVILLGRVQQQERQHLDSRGGHQFREHHRLQLVVNCRQIVVSWQAAATTGSTAASYVNAHRDLIEVPGSPIR